MKQTAEYLKPFFGPIVRQSFNKFIELSDARLQGYVAGILADFCASDRLWSIRSADGKPLAGIGSLIEMSDPVFGRASSFEVEREVRKYIGDYTLFLSGILPVDSPNFRRSWARREEDSSDVVAVGKESYFIVASIDEIERPKEAPLFTDLHRHFELCVEGLHDVAHKINMC